MVVQVKKNGRHERIQIIKKDAEKKTLSRETDRKQIIKWYINLNKPLITLIVNGPNIQIKRHGFSDWIKMHDLVLW